MTRLDFITFFLLGLTVYACMAVIVGRFAHRNLTLTEASDIHSEFRAFLAGLFWPYTLVHPIFWGISKVLIFLADVAYDGLYLYANKKLPPKKAAQ